jgi:uncharacterized membrane protein YphA (DoxX/SURF4 family)
MDILNHHALAPCLLLAMFLMSGHHKTTSLQKTIENVKGKLNVNENIATICTYVVILLEIVAPIVIIYYLLTKQYKQYAVYSVWSLILFTIAATVIYHPPDLSNYYKSIAFWANISLIGGLLLLERTIR